MTLVAQYLFKMSLQGFPISIVFDIVPQLLFTLNSDDIKKDAAMKGFVDADSATVANVAADVGRLQEKLEKEALDKREAA